MSAIITATPTIIDSVNHATDFFEEILPYGKYVTGTNAYQVLATPYTPDPPAGFPTSLRIYKSTNAGVSWVEQDVAGRPVTSGIGLWPLCSTFDSRYIYVVYVIQTGSGPFVGSLYLQIFDTQTDTWGTPGTPSSGDGSQWAGLQTLAVKMSDRIRLFAGGDFVDNIGGVWDASATTFNFGSGDTLGGVVDSLDRTHYVWTRGYQLIAADGTAGAEESSVGDGDGLRCDICFLGADSIAIAWTGASHAINCTVAIGTPLSAAAFTLYTIDTEVSGSVTYATLNIDTGAKIHIVSIESNASDDPTKNYAMALSDPSPANTGKLTVRYILNLGAPLPGTTAQIMQSQYDSGTDAWDAPVVYYDLLANPPVGFDPVDEQFMETGQALFFEGTTTPLSLACPVNNAGAVGVAFSSTLIASGGTAPYTYAITGGALPPGLTLNTSTGVISGIPTASGAYPYTAQVTDSLDATAEATCSILIVKARGIGGRAFIKIRLNLFDACLGRDYRMYERIDRTILSCGVKPACFCIDEREWGTTNDDDEITPGAPAGAIAFNPGGQIVLPTTLSGDNTVFQFRVPVGFDGIILGQFHGYYRTPVGVIIPPNYIEGSGDIIWRISANGRFVRDCGEMIVTLGTIRSQSPIAGGIQLRSQDLVKYIVNVPNTSGSLAPGQGSIIAGMHGYFWPRK